jgi:hypothetical protein
MTGAAIADPSYEQVHQVVENVFKEKDIKDRINLLAQSHSLDDYKRRQGPDFKFTNKELKIENEINQHHLTTFDLILKKLKIKLKILNTEVLNLDSKIIPKGWQREIVESEPVKRIDLDEAIRNGNYPKEKTAEVYSVNVNKKYYTPDELNKVIAEIEKASSENNIKKESS